MPNDFGKISFNKNIVERPPNRILAQEVVSRLHIKMEHLSFSSPEEWKCHCPFHSDRTPSMYINPEKFIYHCFQCGGSGSLYQLYKKITGGELLKDIGIASDEFSSYAYQSTYVEEVTLCSTPISK